jgi:hypothetical protein
VKESLVMALSATTKSATTKSATTKLDRRQLLRAGAGLATGLLLPAHALRAADATRPVPGGALFASACRDARGQLCAIVFDAESGELVCSVELPERGHGIAVRPLGARGDRRREVVTFARRPGSFAVVLDLDRAIAPVWITSRPDRHFFGHGLYSADGRLLYTTENDCESGAGVIGVRDATGGYKQIGELPSGGIEPHEMAMLSDRRTLVVANGGIPSDPAAPRYENTAEMQPSLAYVDSLTGDIVERHELPAELHKLSIRHLCVGARDTVMLGCQWRGPPWQIHSNIGRHRRGSGLELLALADGLDNRIRNYVASVAVHHDGETALMTAPNGGLVLLMEVATGRCLATHAMPDAFGAAEHSGGFLLTAGNGTLAHVGGEHWSQHEVRQQTLATAWDNHLEPVAI